uniref:Adrenomedullin 2a n=1 Tax=Paramormyrops kingsleyae TaxID=1676925 RepID=A0A3B3S9E1_9TELE
MRSIFLVIACCISLLSVQQLLALPLGIRLESNDRWNDRQNILPGSTASPVDANQVESIDDVDGLLRKLRLLATKVATDPTNSHPSQQAAGENMLRRTGSRGRRHAHKVLRGHHQPQLMRVGCILGTCQVQNLSHRLYQLNAQSGREDSSPINPNSPHSFG